MIGGTRSIIGIDAVDAEALLTARIVEPSSK
jgi:hypothetical protein